MSTLRPTILAAIWHPTSVFLLSSSAFFRGRWGHEITSESSRGSSVGACDSTSQVIPTYITSRLVSAYSHSLVIRCWGFCTTFNGDDFVAQAVSHPRHRPMSEMPIKVSGLRYFIKTIILRPWNLIFSLLTSHYVRGAQKLQPPLYFSKVYITLGQLLIVNKAGKTHTDQWKCLVLQMPDNLGASFIQKSLAFKDIVFLTFRTFTLDLDFVQAISKVGDVILISS